MNENATLKVVCCECKTVMKPGSDDKVSHGFCGPCAAKFLWLEGVSKEELTDFIDDREEVSVEA